MQDEGMGENDGN